MRGVLGVDPGRTGGLALLSTDLTVVEPMQSLGEIIDLKWLKSWLEEFREEFSRAFIEEVHAIYGSSAGATFSFGRTCGHIEGVLSALSIPYEFVSPRVWQKEFGITKVRGSKLTTKEKKERCILAAQRVFPKVDMLATPKSRVPHLGIVDALLIAEYGRRRG